jgi:vancomycin resistance protein VanW
VDVTVHTGQRRRVTQRFPALIPARMAQRRLTKRVQDARAGYHYPTTRSEADLAWLIAHHSSILERDLQGVDPQLQRNKVQNLRLAAGRIDGVILSPGQTFSFWRLVGRATERGGYTDGLVLRDGPPHPGWGAGCARSATCCTGWPCTATSR